MCLVRRLLPVSRKPTHMVYQPETSFDSIESAQEYLTLLAEVIAENRRDVTADCDLLAQDGHARRHEAMQVVAYKLARLEEHVSAGRRLLNDLRMLRRLLLSERVAPLPDPAGARSHPLDLVAPVRHPLPAER